MAGCSHRPQSQRKGTSPCITQLPHNLRSNITGVMKKLRSILTKRNHFETSASGMIDLDFLLHRNVASGTILRGRKIIPIHSQLDALRIFHQQICHSAPKFFQGGKRAFENTGKGLSYLLFQVNVDSSSLRATRAQGTILAEAFDSSAAVLRMITSTLWAERRDSDSRSRSASAKALMLSGCPASPHDVSHTSLKPLLSLPRL